MRVILFFSIFTLIFSNYINCDFAIAYYWTGKIPKSDPDRNEVISNKTITLNEIPPQMRRTTVKKGDKKIDELAKKGSLTLNNCKLVIDSPGSANICVHTLNIEGGTTIITNGSTLKIVAINIHASSGLIISYADADLYPVAAQPMQPGKNGKGGGRIEIEILQTITGLLRVHLPGQNGGLGGQGKTGAQGARGERGTDAASSAIECRRGAGRGKPGKTGEKGGKGLRGGNGGNGGDLIIFADHKHNDSIDFSAPGGNGGLGGSGGLGGPGGPGGKGGKYSNPWCSSGDDGPKGLQGPNGDIGSQGRPGKPGKMKLKQ